MKTLKFMLAAATAIGLASAYAEPESGASTTFESLTNGTPVVTGLNDEGGSTGLSYYYYAGSVAEDNESVIAAGTPDIARPTGATGDRSKILQVSTGTDPLLRAFTSFTQGSSPISSAFTQDVYVDTLVQFTVTPYTDTVTPTSSDKLMVYLKESVVTNEFGDITSASTNLVVVGGYYSNSGTLSTKEYVVVGATVAPNTWHRLTVQAIPDVLLDENDEGVEGSKCIGFVVYLDGSSTPCQFNSRTFDLQDETSFTFFGPSKYFADLIEPSKLVLSIKGMVSGDSTLQAVGFAGEGKVDDLMITTVDPFFTAVDFTFAAVSGVTATQTPGTDNWTFTAPEGTVIKSFLVNGNPVAAAVGATSYSWTAAAADAGALVIVSAGKQLTAAAHPWYESPKGFVLAENLPIQDSANVSAFHGQGQEEYLGLTYTTNPLQFDLFNVDGTNALTSVYNVPTNNAPATPGFRGVAISKALGVAMTLAYATSTKMYAYPLTPGTPIEVTKPATHSFDAAAFSPDGKYLFSNALNGEGSNQYYVKWSVAMTTNSLTLTKVGSIDAGGRGRSMAYARINGRDLVFGLVDASKVVVLDMTDADASAWTATDLITDLPAHSYGTLCVSGVEATGATPKLTVATSVNNNNGVDVLNVYTLTVPASGAVTAALTKSFSEADLTAAFLGDISDAIRYGNTVYVTDDDATIYLARPDQKLYAGIYVPKYDITFSSGAGATATNEVVSVYEGDTPVAPAAAEIAGKEFTAWDPALAPATAAATYTATYDWITYTITYLNADETTFTDFMDGYTAPATFTAETPVTLPTSENMDFSVVGVMFDSWTNAAGTAVSSTAGLYENLTVFAKLTAVVPPSGEELEPGQKKEYSAEPSAAELAEITIVPSDAVSNALETAGVSIATYTAMFETVKTYDSAAGKWYAEVVPTAATTNALQIQVNAGVAEVVTNALTTRSVTITATPGFYYWVEHDTALSANLSYTTERVLADDNEVTIQLPSNEGVPARFYKVKADIVPAPLTGGEGGQD